jgi:DNA polymerase III subunit delta'
MNIWKGFYGQDNVKNILESIISSGKIPHAFLFSGHEGTGKYFCSLKFAQAVNKNSSNTSVYDAISKLSEPYVKFIFPLPRGKNETETSSPYDKLSSEEIQLIQEQLEIKKQNPYYKIVIPKANIIKISSIRDIKKFLTYDYNDITYRFIIINDCHLMNEESQNSLLKNLEEPPPGIIFILITPYPGVLRETIRSRCWQINFQPLANDHVSRILVEYFSIEPEKANTAARFSNGSVNFALKLLENDLDGLLERTISILRYSFGKKINSAHQEIAALLEEDEPEIFRLLIQLIITWLNDVLKYRTGISEIAYEKHIETIEKFSKKFPDADMAKAAGRLEYLVSLIRNNVNLNIISLNTIYTLSDLVEIPSKK